ncbi:tachylectin-related carbohydrate-binding protein [Lentzea sp. NPDC051213]|uniref:tachylectin-related carbohydrate-binding protein n=1 Tax=Lentzea sp. NPDC051213 TaxID=3364126 RepID=UPI0037ABC854
MNRRLRSLCLAAATLATTVTAVTVVASTAAAADTTCKPAANIFTMQADGDLWVYPHAGPANGSFSWGAAKQVGWGWGGKTFAGPNGWLFNITTGGELRRLRYNGSGWDTFPGGGQYETFGWGWQKYVESANRSKITVDADGSFYTLEGDQLRWWHYEQDTRQWAPGSGRVLDTGWSRFDVIAASGNGGLQARDSAGTLHRFRYHRATERFVAHDMLPSTTWQGQTRLFSAGGDVYYAVRPDTGQLLWNRYDEYVDNGAWQTSGGNVIGTGWGTDVDITATTNDCSVSGLRTPAYPHVSDDNAVAPRVITPASGGTHLVDINSGNEVIDTYSTESGWTSRVVGGRYSGVSSPALDDDAGTAVVGVTEFETGDVKLITLRDGQWQAQSLKGGMEFTPAVVRRSDGTHVVYATGDKNNGPERRGRAYFRQQLTSGEFLAWRPFGDPRTGYFATPSVISRGDETTIVLSTTGLKEWFRHSPGTAPVHKGRLNSNTTQVVLTGDGQDGILAVGYFHADGKNQIGLLREKADRSGFEETWEPVGGGMPTGAVYEPIDAQLLPNGSVAVSALVDSNQLVVSTSSVVGGREFLPWKRVTPEGYPHTFYVEPGLGLTRSGDVALAAMDSNNAHHLWTASVTPDPAAPLQFTGGKLG